MVTMSHIIGLLCLLAIVYVEAVSPHTQALLDQGQAAISVPAFMGRGNRIVIPVTIGSQTFQILVDIASNALLLFSNSVVNTPTYVACGCNSGQACKVAAQTYGQGRCSCSSSNTCQVAGGFSGGSYTAQAINSVVTIGSASKQIPVFLSNMTAEYGGILGLAPRSGVGPALFGSNAIGFCLDANGDQGKVIFGNPNACSSSISYVPMFQSASQVYQNGFFVTFAQVCVGSSCSVIPAPTFSLPSGAPSQGQPSFGWLAYVDSGNPYFGVPSASYATIQTLINQLCANDATCKSTFPNPMPASGWACVNLTTAQLAHWPVFSLYLNTGVNIQIRDYAFINTGTCPAGRVIFTLRQWIDNTWALDTALLTSYYTVFDSPNGRVGFLGKSSGSSCGSC